MDNDRSGKKGQAPGRPLHEEGLEQELASSGEGSGATKKAQILALCADGVSDIGELAALTQSQPSYVTSVMRQAGLAANYYDLYTPTGSAMNIYAPYFAGKVGFKDEATARQSVEVIDRFYKQFDNAEDRAGQHHSMTIALTMFNRARWLGKLREADIFRRWLFSKLKVESESLH